MMVNCVRFACSSRVAGVRGVLLTDVRLFDLGVWGAGRDNNREM